MLNKFKLKIISVATLLSSQIAIVSAAAPGNVVPVTVPDDIKIPEIVTNIMNWGFGLLIVLAALFVLWAAYLYLTAGIVEGNMNKAKQFILYAVMALVVGFIAKSSVTIVRSLLGI